MQVIWGSTRAFWLSSALVTLAAFTIVPRSARDTCALAISQHLEFAGWGCSRCSLHRSQLHSEVGMLTSCCLSTCMRLTKLHLRLDPGARTGQHSLQPDCNACAGHALSGAASNLLPPAAHPFGWSLAR